jgi:hypothetical protein
MFDTHSNDMHNANNDVAHVAKSDSTGIPEAVPYGPSPATPSQEDLIKVSRTPHDSLVMMEGLAHLRDQIFEGWTYQIFPDNDHRYRYILYKKGRKVWQIGYFANGILDHDFHVYHDKNKGSQRMWRANGSPYIDNFFLEGGILHGIQRRWYADYRLAMESKYEEGRLIYKKEYDETGNLINKK